MTTGEHFENLIKKMGGNPDTLPDNLLTAYLEYLCACATAPEGVTTFTDSGNGDLALNGATGQTGKRFLASMAFPGLTSKYISALHNGTFSDPYGIKVVGGASLIDAINALTEPGIYTIYQNRASTDAPDGAKAINSSLRGLACLSQINKHYAFHDRSGKQFLCPVCSGQCWRRLENDVPSRKSRTGTEKPKHAYDQSRRKHICLRRKRSCHHRNVKCKR